MMTRDEVNAAYPNLQGLDLHRAYLSGANLSGAKNAIDLGDDPRGYRFIAVAHADGWRIKAGCRWFTVDEALAHWANNPDALARVRIASSSVRRTHGDVD